MADHHRHPNWELALKILADVLPGSTDFLPDKITGLTTESWQRFDIEDRDPLEVETDLLAYCKGRIHGLLVVVTDGVYLNRISPFFVDARRLDHLISEHASLTQDVFISGDVVIVAPEIGRVIVVHHSGLITTLEGQIAILGTHDESLESRPSDA